MSLLGRGSLSLDGSGGSGGSGMRWLSSRKRFEQRNLSFPLAIDGKTWKHVPLVEYVWQTHHICFFKIYYWCRCRWSRRNFQHAMVGPKIKKQAQGAEEDRSGTWSLRADLLNGFGHLKVSLDARRYLPKHIPVCLSCLDNFPVFFENGAVIIEMFYISRMVT